MTICDSKAISFIHSFLLLFLIACGEKTNNNEKSTYENESPQNEANASGLVSEEVSRTIAETLTMRCNQLFNSRLRDNDCKQGMKILAKELDFRIAIGTTGETAFTFLASSLEKILADRHSLQFMDRLQEKIYSLLYDGHGFNLWDFALAESNQDEKLALERIGVLLQDGSENATQVKYLLTKKHPMAFKLEELLRSISFAQKTGKLVEYPSDFISSRHTIYHYYVPRLLAMRLKGKNLPENLSGVFSFLFNSSYELRQIHLGKETGKNSSDIASQAKFYAEGDPKLEKLFVRWHKFDAQYTDLIDHLTGPFLPFNPSVNSENLEDIYLGYLGSIHGSSGKGEKSCIDSLSKCLSREDFSGRFSKNPTAFLNGFLP